MLEADNGLFVENKKLSFIDGFNGTTQIGTIKVKGLRAGLNRIWIVNNSVDTSLADLNVVTDGVAITVRE